MATHIEIADNYFQDCEEFLHRYRITFNHFTSLKSKRFKLFIDLRMALECVLKAHLVYFEMREISRKEIIDKLAILGHKISELTELVSDSLPHTKLEDLRLLSKTLKELPVGLRYNLDQVDFRYVREDLYYETVGSDAWLKKLYDITDELSDSISKNLQTHSKATSTKDLMNDILTPKYNKILGRNL